MEELTVETIADDVEIEHDGSSDAFAVSCKTTPGHDLPPPKTVLCSWFLQDLMALELLLLSYRWNILSTKKTLFKWKKYLLP